MKGSNKSRRPSTKNLEKLLRARVNEIRKASLFPANWTLIAARELNETSEAREFTPEYVNQVGLGRYYNKEVIQFLIKLADENEVSKLISKADEVLRRKSS